MGRLLPYQNRIGHTERLMPINSLSKRGRNTSHSKSVTIEWLGQLSGSRGEVDILRKH